MRIKEVVKMEADFVVYLFGKPINVYFTDEALEKFAEYEVYFDWDLEGSFIHVLHWSDFDGIDDERYCDLIEEEYCDFVECIVMLAVLKKILKQKVDITNVDSLEVEIDIDDVDFYRVRDAYNRVLALLRSK
jgi:hypothetical protein